MIGYKRLSVPHVYSLNMEPYIHHAPIIKILTLFHTERYKKVLMPIIKLKSKIGEVGVVYVLARPNFVRPNMTVEKI